MEDRVRTSLALTASTIIGLAYAFYNHFPLTYTDSGTYIASGASMFVPIDRPLAYGLFIHFTSLGASLWLTILTQSALASWLVYELIKRLTPDNRRLLLVFSFGLLSVTTGLSLTISILSPDIFAPLVVIVALLLILPGTAQRKRFALILLFFAFDLFHMSDALVSAGLISLVIIATFLFRRSRQVDRRWMWIVFAAALGSPLLMATLNWSVDGRFAATDATHVFLTASLAEKGVLQAYLDHSCEKDADAYSLCRYRNVIPHNATQFIWGENSVVTRTRGWQDPGGQYRRLLHRILLNPKYLAMTFAQSVKATIAQFFDFDLHGYGYPTARTADTAAVNNYYQREFPAFLAARQYRHQLDYNLISRIQTPLVYATLLIWAALIVFARRLRLSDTNRFILLYTMAALWVNAGVTATFSSVVDRYQSRIVWLLVLVVGISLFCLIKRLMLAPNSDSSTADVVDKD